MNLRGQWQSLVSVNGPVVEIGGGECQFSNILVLTIESQHWYGIAGMIVVTEEETEG